MMGWEETGTDAGGVKRTEAVQHLRQFEQQIKKNKDLKAEDH